MDEVKRIRNERGLSQQRLCDMAGVNKVTLIRIEHGTGNPNVETLEKLARALDVEIATFFPKAEPSLFDNGEQRRWRNPDATEARRIAEEIDVPASLDSLNIVDTMREAVIADRRRNEQQFERAVESHVGQTTYGSVVGELEHRLEDRLGWAFDGFMYSGLLSSVRRLIDLEEENARLRGEVEAPERVLDE